MRLISLLLILAMALLATNVSAYYNGYYYSGQQTPYGYSYESYSPSGYYGYEQWNGYTKWDYYASNGRYYSYYGPSYYGYHYPVYNDYSYGYYGHYPSAVYYHAPYYGYYDYGMHYYEPGFSISVGW